MRKVTVSELGAEVAYVGQVVCQAHLFAACGVELHAPGDVLTSENARLLGANGLDELLLLEPGERPEDAALLLGAERVPPAELRVGDVLVREVRGPRGHPALPAGTRVDAQALAEPVLRCSRLSRSAPGSARPRGGMRRNTLRRAVAPPPA